MRAAESRGLVLGALAGKGVTPLRHPRSVPIAGRPILVGNLRMLRGRHRGAEAVPALAAADLSMDIAIERPGILRIGGDLGGIVRARRLSAATMTNTRRNVIFALLYKAVGIPAYGRPVLSRARPEALTDAAAAMALASVSLSANALKLKGAKAVVAAALMQLKPGRR